MSAVTSNYNNNGPPRHTVIVQQQRHAVTSNISKDTERLLNISNYISVYFLKRAQEDEHIANEMRIALKEAKNQNAD